MEPIKEENLLKDSTIFDRLKAGFKDRFGEGREDYRQAYYGARDLMGKDAEDARIKTTLATNPTFVTARDLLGISEPIYKGQREERGMSLSTDRDVKIGQVAGTLANDLVQDSSRGLWWLLNAPQATGNVLNELALSIANPDLFSHEMVQKGGATFRVPVMEENEKGEIEPKRYTNDDLSAENYRNYRTALAQDLISAEGVKRKGIGQKYDKKSGSNVYTQRKYNPGDVAALAVPTGVAINAGIGLLNPLGGSGGYSAVIPSDEDPSKTANPVLEVAAKYILGKTGNLLPYEEFKEERPDVSRGEYNAYKAFKYDKKGDYNIFDDGKVTLPTGVVKATVDGIHGPEVQFLGRSLPATTTLVPFLGALAGGVAGVRTKRPIKGGIIGGTLGLAAGSAAGLITEQIRRRASSVTNDQLQYPQ